MPAVKLWGGLGNQLFLYAFGRYLEVERKEKALFYSVPFQEQFRSTLQNLNTSLEFLSEETLRKYHKLNPSGYSYRLERKLIQKFPSLNPKVYVENNLWFKSSFPLKAKLFDGYFQSFKYPESIENLLRLELIPKVDLLTRIKNGDELTRANSVSVHFRRGDYLSESNRKLFASPGKEYYIKAIEFIGEKVSDPVFYLFSNDSSWLKSNSEIFSTLNYQIIDNSKSENSELTDLFLMSRCAHHIIANSTFSWWGAWLNRNPDKIVVAPLNWYRNRNLNQTTVDLIPPSWIRL